MAKTEITHNGYGCTKREIKDKIDRKDKTTDAIVVGYIVVPTIPSDDDGTLVEEMIGDGLFTRKAMLRCAFGQGMALELGKKLKDQFQKTVAKEDTFDLVKAWSKYVTADPTLVTQFGGDGAAMEAGLRKLHNADQVVDGDDPLNGWDITTTYYPDSI